MAKIFKKEMLDPSKPVAGVYAGLSHKEYSELPFVRKSYLYRLGKCPAKALVPEKDTPAMAFGRGFHSLVLDGKKAFDEEYYVVEPMDLRTKEGKLAKANALELAKGKDLIDERDFTKMLGMYKAVQNHPSAMVLLKEGVTEQTIIWRDDESGIWCKCRPDHSTYAGHRTLVDLKKVTSADAHAFQRDIVKFGYDLQAGMYLTGAVAATGERYTDFVFIAVEDEEPYRVEVYALSEQFIKRGVFEFKRLLRLEAECRKAGKYPNYKHAGIESMEMPGYLTEESGVMEALQDGVLL